MEKITLKYIEEELYQAGMLPTERKQILIYVKLLLSIQEQKFLEDINYINNKLVNAQRMPDIAQTYIKRILSYTNQLRQKYSNTNTILTKKERL